MNWLIWSNEHGGWWKPNELGYTHTRVSGQTMIELNEVVRQWCILRVARLPSMGKTI